MEWLEQVPQIPLQCLGGASLQGMVKSDGDIQSELAVFLPSAQTFINITSRPTGRPTSNLGRKKEDDMRLRTLLNMFRANRKRKKNNTFSLHGGL